MKTFIDIKFEPHAHFAGGVAGKLFFDNGYGVSVINGQGAYASGNDEYELAVLKGDEKDWELTYDTEITDDVLGHLSVEEVDEIIRKVQSL